jgi:hypothetical protein
MRWKVPKRHLNRPVGRDELRALAALAREEEHDFFERNAHLIRPYRRRLVAAALCQGAALQHLGIGYGVNDFDIHYFYAQNPTKPRLTRARMRQIRDVGSFHQIAVDFLRTVIPIRVVRPRRSSTIRVIQAFLDQRPTDNARHLARKAVIGLIPADLFGVVIWPADRRHEGVMFPKTPVVP